MKCWLQGRCDCSDRRQPGTVSPNPAVFGARVDGAGIAWLLEQLAVPDDIRSVALKLNLCEYRSGASGSTTTLAFVREVVAALRERCPALMRVVLLEADSSGTRVADLFPLLGFTELAADAKCELFDPVTAAWRRVDEVAGLPIEVPEIVYDVDLLVNLPKLKFHGKSGYTGALKNNFGLLRRKWKLPYHKALCETIIASNLHLPRQLILADGTVTLSGRGPSYGIPVRSEVALGSWDPVAVDAAGTKLLGVPPVVPGHLRMASRAGLGTDSPLVRWRDERRLAAAPSFDWFRFVMGNALRRS